MVGARTIQKKQMWAGLARFLKFKIQVTRHKFCWRGNPSNFVRTPRAKLPREPQIFPIFFVRAWHKTCFRPCSTWNIFANEPAHLMDVTPAHEQVPCQLHDELARHLLDARSPTNPSAGTAPASHVLPHVVLARGCRVRACHGACSHPSSVVPVTPPASTARQAGCGALSPVDTRPQH